MMDRSAELDFPVLIVEDSVDSRELLKRLLVKAGIEVCSVENGEQALDAFEDRFFPIVLTDWMMPKLDGVDLCRALRQRQKSGYVYIILLTARGSTDEIVTGLEAGADEYLTKPFNSAELLARLKTAKRIITLERTLKKANEEIKLLSITDPLTGCYNRGYLTERFPEEIQRADRYGHPLSIILCDIDKFKRINDTYGHEAGNATIKAFTKAITKTVRQDVDWVARYGGEEFLVVLPETDTAGALKLAERIRVNISRTVIHVNQHDISITASFGVVGLDPTSSDRTTGLEDMVNLADRHLYDCKVQGRNSVRGSTLERRAQNSANVSSLQIPTPEL